MHQNEVDSKTSKISRIISKKSGKELSISTDSQTSGVLVLGDPVNDSRNRFLIEYHQTHHKIQSLLTKQYVTVHRSSNKAGSVMLTLPNCEAESQKLHLKKLQTPNEYIITTFCGLALDCFEEGEKQGTLIVQWHQNGKSHQIWIVEDA